MTPPKDRLFLADVGFPSLMMTHWCEPSKKFVCANLCVDCYEGEWNDWYFENERFDENEIKGWIEVPKCFIKLTEVEQ